MQITVNGEANDLGEVEVNLSKLLEIRKVESPEMVAVQLNCEWGEMNSYPTIVEMVGGKL